MSTIVYAHKFEPRFRPFLQTPLWEERTDAPLSLLSALARLDLDPWQEAADLSHLPRAAAAARLGGLLKRLPPPPFAAEFDTLCQRAVELLPDPEPAKPLAPAGDARAAGRVFLVDAVLVACFLTTLVLMSNFAARAPVAPNTAPTAANSPR